MNLKGGKEESSSLHKIFSLKISASLILKKAEACFSLPSKSIHDFSTRTEFLATLEGNSASIRLLSCDISGVQLRLWFPASFSRLEELFILNHEIRETSLASQALSHYQQFHYGPLFNWILSSALVGEESEVDSNHLACSQRSKEARTYFGKPYWEMIWNYRLIYSWYWRKLI